MPTQWHLLNSQVQADWLGFLPMMLSEADPRPAREQFDTAYSYGGGWRPFEGFRFSRKGDDHTSARLHYPGDPPMLPIGYTQLRDETIYLFEGSWVCIVQPDGSTNISRMD